MKKSVTLSILAVVCIAAILFIWLSGKGQKQIVSSEDDRYNYLLQSNSARLDGINIESSFYDGENYVYGIHYPVTANKSVNQEIKSLVYSHLNTFVQDAEDYFNGPQPPGGFSANWKYELNIDYDIDRPAPDVVSIKFSIIEYTGGAHPNHSIATKTYNLDTGKEYTLDDIFLKDSGYLNTISEIAYTQLKENKDLSEYLDEDWLREGTSPTLENYEHFILEEDSIVFYFSRYQVGPYVIGEQSVLIPYTTLDDLLQIRFSDLPESTFPVIPPVASAAPDLSSDDQLLVALTFDDGPHAENTAQILDVLETHDAVATFFVVGNRAQYYPELLQRMVAGGNEIGIHTWDHKDLTKLGPEEIQTEIQDTAEIVYASTGIWPQCVRPPYAAINDTVKQNAGLPLIMWSVDPRDWDTEDTEAIVTHVLENTRDGYIVLMHDLYAHSAAAVEDIVTSLQEEGYRFVTVSQLLGFTEDTINESSGIVYREKTTDE